MKNIVGYVYLTENLINHRKYVGKHLSKKYDRTYLGSGKILKNAIKKYGKENFSNVILYTAEEISELNVAEKYYIHLYRKQFGDSMYNLAGGGDGGNVFRYADEDAKKAFVQKMTEINKERCKTDEFKNKISNATSSRFTDPTEREKQSKRIRAIWDNEELKRAQSDRLLKYYSTHKKDSSFQCKQCVMEFEGNTYLFDSRKSLDRFLKQEFDVVLNRKIETRLLMTGEPYIPFHKNKLNRICGMKIYYKQQNENVETIGDECNRVECEIGTHSKCKTEIEDIVQPV